ncbi:hypothetical protein [Pediococcus cellicola]|uniref:TPR repeat-containing protein n=1 Tax=Pediococcus cellicola TaxID=319652 RepID=A0A0R2IV94_9LACO|nr:hypothetical protein [Pediococcus cellicola]KRN67478.1 hypothetical protein IV80_GL000017 [Pediococcus cellicola]GEL14538.1 hypothetical protein PCE01_03400 [Pediococcus cellicola]
MNAEQLNKIQAAVSKSNWEKVLTLIEPFNDEAQQDKQLNTYFVQGLFQTKHYVEALKYANDALEFYLDDDQGRSLYFEILLACQDFLDAYKFLKSLQQRQISTDQFVTALRTKEVEVSAQKNTLKQKMKKFYHVGDLDLQTTQNVLEEAKQLPAQAYFAAAKFIFLDPFVHPLIRATVLENVSFMNFNETIKYYWIDDANHDVALGGLEGILHNKVDQQLSTVLQKKLANQDPILLDGITKEKNLYLSYAYPFAEHIFETPEDWVAYWLEESYGRNHSTVTASPEIAKWQAKFQAYTQQLLSDQH